MQKLEDFEFYEADEHIKSLPRSFGLITEPTVIIPMVGL